MIASNSTMRPPTSHQRHHLQIKPIFYINSGPIVDMSNIPINSLVPLLHRMHANLCKQIIFSNDLTGLLQIYMINFRHLQLHLYKLGFNKWDSLYVSLEVLHIWRAKPFRFLREIVVALSESNIPLTLIIRSIINGPHSSLCSTLIGSRVPTLCMTFFITIDFQLTPLLQLTQLSPS